MRQVKKEQGYALLIVLFAIVFITVITAVFMRGAISNATQGQTLDENNLVVVSAEAGVDYYTWHLKQLYDEQQLEAEFNSLVNGYIADKKPINYTAIQLKMVGNFRNKLETKIQELKKLKDSPETDLFNTYTHHLTAADVDKEQDGSTAYLLVKGRVEGKLPQGGKPKTKNLDFEFRFIFPQVLTADGGKPENPDDKNDSTGSLIGMPVLKAPAPPATPEKPAAISKPASACHPKGRLLENQQCAQQEISEPNYTINKSGVYLTGKLDSWGNVHVENSSLNIRGNFTPASFLAEDTLLVVGGLISTYQPITINKTKLQASTFINGHGKAKISNSHLTINDTLTFQQSEIENSFIITNTYKANDNATFKNTDFNVKKIYESKGAEFHNSRIEIGETMSFGGGLFYVEGSDIKINKDVTAANGSRIFNSRIQIGGGMTHNQTVLLSKNSDISIGGEVKATNGTDLEHVKMLVKGKYTANENFKLDNSKLIISSGLSLTNGGDLENSLLTAASITSSTPLKLENSIMATGSLDSDVLRLENAKVCAGNLKVRDLKMDGNSKIYYQTQTSNPNHSNKNIIQLAPEEFSKKCAVQTEETPEEPENTGTIDWKAPVVDKVTY
ncbi:hypothetical protein [Sporosarcina trichiuri]|uniref:hypothetical protein n=1 Tax=Sporosarcina trichiuri TaxID=3056445 RepID=UPI0025B41937|nr:hypothetical protein [Sporosarcina sp. 0.2-SM1T-5]WJY26441.1 hypothetical protein QWT68_10150 [Sporosarcina sp. 0.2-SM1T-5]